MVTTIGWETEIHDSIVNFSMPIEKRFSYFTCQCQDIVWLYCWRYKEN